MKVQLEFEKPDLEEMLARYFEKSGFAIKNLEQLCEQFASAFPEGIKVQAEILPNFEAPAREESRPNYLGSEEFEQEEEEPEPEPEVESEPEDPISEVVEIVEERLTHADLMDPTRPVPGNETKDMAEIMRLVRKSKVLEQTR